MNASCLPGTRVKEGECEYLMNRYGEWIGAGNFGFSIRVEERNRNGALREAERRSSGGQEQAIIAGSGRELHVPIPSAGVGLEHDGELSQDIGRGGDRWRRILGG